MCGGVRTAGQRSQGAVRIPLWFEFMADSPADEALGEEDSQPVDEEDSVNEGDMDVYNIVGSPAQDWKKCHLVS